MSASLAPKSYDVIVVGMGPAGAMAAFELSQAGVSVLGLEKQVHPRYKVCGGGLSARIEQILPLDFKAVIEETVYRIQFTYGGKESYLIESSLPIAYMVMRSDFDRWLRDKAQHAGTEVRENEPAIEVAALPDGVEVGTAKGRYRSRVVIGADGAMSLVAQRLFPGRRLRKIPALESEILKSPGSHPVQMDLALVSLSAAKRGYGWIFPKRDSLSVGVGEFVNGPKRPKRSFHEFFREEPLLERHSVPRPMGHPIPIFNRDQREDGYQWNGGLVNHRGILVGDAAHLVDPLLGEGIYYAVRSGQLAASTILDVFRNPQRRLNEYETAVIQEFGQEFRIASRLSRIVYDLPRSWHRWAGRTFPRSYQQVLSRYCELLQGRETYQSLWARITRRLKWPFAKASERGSCSLYE